MEKDEGKELQYLMSKDKVLQQLRECAENVKEGNPTVNAITPVYHIPDNCCHLEPGTYSGEELGAVIYFIADMLE